MSVSKTMHTGVSGLLAETQALGVVGNNIANVNTHGFKYSRSQFENVLSSLRDETGMGVRAVRSQQIFSQGALLNTNVPTDLALSGDGFFVVSGRIDGAENNFYSRAGQFSVRKDGALVNPQGLELQGYQALVDGGFETSLSTVQLPTTSLEPKPTDGVEVVANLDANALPPGVPFDVNDPVNTSNFSTSMTVYDPQGNSHVVDVYFTKTNTANEWHINVLADSGEVTTPPPANPTDDNTLIGKGIATFDGNGKLDSLTPVVSNGISFNNSGSQTINFDFGDPLAGGGTGQLGLTQYGSPSNVAAQSQNGYTAGDLNGVDITSDGVVNGVFSNGERLAISKVAVAKFPANEELANLGHNLWGQTGDAGEPTIGDAGVGGRATVIAGSLEQSNVDLAGQFVSMITHQRAFSANARTISTADEMLMETLQIKR